MAHLDTEISYYEQNEKEFLKNNKFDWVLISGKQTLGYYKTIDDASKAFKSLYTGDPILMRRIGVETPAHHRIQFATI